MQSKLTEKFFVVPPRMENQTGQQLVIDWPAAGQSEDVDFSSRVL